MDSMKKSSACNRSKPPPVRSSYLFGKLRNNLGAEGRSGFHSQIGMECTKRLLSMSENPEVTETIDKIEALKTSSKEVTDCLTGWLTFIQMLKGLCSAGAQLSHCLGELALQSPTCTNRAAQCQAMWEHLSNAATAAATVVKSQAVSALQEAHTGPDIDADQIETNQQVVCNGLVTLVNLQHQFSLACCECLGGSTIGECQCQPLHSHAESNTQAVSRCFIRGPPSHKLPPSTQRRWSEATPSAAAEVPARRWSMPWKLSLPTGSHPNDRSRSTTPDAIWHTALASQEELQDVITLLSIKPGPQCHNLPGVVLTRAVEPIARSCSSHRGSWWGEGEEPEVGMLVSRKSSSSTDCSSCYSLHSRTSTSGSGSVSGADEPTHGQRSLLYSMWSGSDLPFIKLPESTEHNTDA